MYVRFFFFQAEDGIRDLVRSRGLGDVYKRQVLLAFRWAIKKPMWLDTWIDGFIEKEVFPDIAIPVSYTHLTLPTSDLV